MLELSLTLGEIVLQEGRLAKVFGCREDTLKQPVPHLCWVFSCMRWPFFIEGAQLLTQCLNCMWVHTDVVQDVKVVPFHVHVSQA